VCCAYATFKFFFSSKYGVVGRSFVIEPKKEVTVRDFFKSENRKFPEMNTKN
jgi:hypothetical protein